MKNKEGRLAVSEGECGKLRKEHLEKTEKQTEQFILSITLGNIIF